LKGIRYCNYPDTELFFPGPNSDTFWTDLVYITKPIWGRVLTAYLTAMFRLILWSLHPTGFQFTVVQISELFLSQLFVSFGIGTASLEKGNREPCWFGRKWNKLDTRICRRQAYRNNVFLRYGVFIYIKHKKLPPNTTVDGVCSFKQYI
jgi:hypothetical protein